MKRDFTEKKVLITGGGSGLGKLTSQLMGSRGAEVILIDINQSALDTALADLENMNIKASGYLCDMSDYEMIETQAKKIQNEHNFVDILINCAGIVTGKPFGEYSIKEAELSFKVNVLGPMTLLKAFFPIMKSENRGHIVNIASAAGLIGAANLTDYCGTKFAIFGFNEALRVELKKRRLKVKTTVICPFFINTGMFEGVKTRIPLLLPILKEEKVVKRIVNAIKREQKQLFMPPIVYLIPSLRLLSAGFLDFASNLLGVNNCMDKFVGRNKN